METEKKRLPYNQELTVEMIRLIRHTRNLTLKEFSEYMGVDAPTICRIEKGHLQFSPYYESKLRDAIRKLKLSGHELAAIRNLIVLKK